MPGAEKMRHMTKFELKIDDKDSRLYTLPASTAKAVLKLVKGHEVFGSDGEPLVAIEDVFPDMKDDRKRPAAILRGYRNRDEISQVELAKRLGITQADISNLESSRRPISKKMAEKLAKIFRTSYRVFL